MMSEFDWAIREMGTGIITFLSAIMTAGLLYYIYNHRITMTVEQRDARRAAVGFAVFFGALALRGLELWWMATALRHGWPLLPGTGTNTIFFFVLAMAIVGAVLTLRAFHPWPVWALMLAFSVLVPLILVLV